MGDREAAGRQFGKQRLHIAQDGFAGRRIAHMAKRRAAPQPVDDLLGWRNDRRPGPAGVRSGSARRRRRQCPPLPGPGAAARAGQGRQGSRIGMSEDAEHAAFLAQPVAIEIEFAIVPVHHLLIRVALPPKAGCSLVSAVGGLLPAALDPNCRDLVPRFSGSLLLGRGRLAAGLPASVACPSPDRPERQLVSVSAISGGMKDQHHLAA